MLFREFFLSSECTAVVAEALTQVSLAILWVIYEFMSEQEYARSFCIDKHRIPTNSNIELMLGNPIPSTRTTLRLFGRNRQTLEPPNFRTAKRVSNEKLWPGSIEFIFKL